MFDDIDPSAKVLDLDDEDGEEKLDEEDLGLAGLHLEEDPLDPGAAVIVSDDLVDDDELEEEPPLAPF